MQIYDNDGSQLGSARDVAGTPADFGMELLPPELDRLDHTLQLVMNRVPVAQAAGIKATVNGATTFASDEHPLIGPAFGVETYFLLTAFTAGIMESGGAAMCLARWIVEGRPPYDMTAFIWTSQAVSSARRFSRSSGATGSASVWCNLRWTIRRANA